MTKQEAVIVVTGAAGFIGSCLVSALNEKGYSRLILVDDFTRPEKERNLAGKGFLHQIDRSAFLEWINEPEYPVMQVFHLGARTDTAEFDIQLLDNLNTSYTRGVWEACAGNRIPLIYASSAATYGLGENGYEDEHGIIPLLKPLNPYGQSKQAFDIWALAAPNKPPYWAGLKFFNVYGPNEYHKGRMASVIFHAFRQIQSGGAVRLFKSHITEYQDGQQLRDFIYVKDVVDTCVFLMENKVQPGIYNLGTGQARSFLDLSIATFKALDLPAQIEFIDIPADIRDKYQYFTEAKMMKLRSQGYNRPFTALEEGVKDYVNNYLVRESYY